MTSAVRIGAVCAEFGYDKDANLKVLEDHIRAAAADRIQLLVFPECALQGYPMSLAREPYTDHYQQLQAAETVPGPALDHLARIAADNAVEVILGLTERSRESGHAGRVFNAQVFLKDGVLAARYRKIHTGGVEKCLWSRGLDWIIADSVAGRLGLLLCYDLVFPEAARCLALAGADVLVMSTAWTSGPIQEAYDLLTRTRALENQVFLVASNQTGGTGDTFYGHSRVVSPKGEVLAECAGPGVAVADIDVAEGVLDARARGWAGQIFLADREPAAYQSLTTS